MKEAWIKSWFTWQGENSTTSMRKRLWGMPTLGSCYALLSSWCQSPFLSAICALPRSKLTFDTSLQSLKCQFRWNGNLCRLSSGNARKGGMWSDGEHASWSLLAHGNLRIAHHVVRTNLNNKDSHWVWDCTCICRMDWKLWKCFEAPT